MYKNVHSRTVGLNLGMVKQYRSVGACIKYNQRNPVLKKNHVTDSVAVSFDSGGAKYAIITKRNFWLICICVEMSGMPLCCSCVFVFEPINRWEKGHFLQSGIILITEESKLSVFLISCLHFCSVFIWVNYVPFLFKMINVNIFSHGLTFNFICR